MLARLTWADLFESAYPNQISMVFPPFVDFSSLRTPGVWWVMAGFRCPCCLHQWQKQWKGESPVDISPRFRSPPAAHSEARKGDRPGGSEQPLPGPPAGCSGLTTAPDFGWAAPRRGWWLSRQLLDQSGATHHLSCCISGRLGLTCTAQIPLGKGLKTERLTFLWRLLHSTEKEEHTWWKLCLRFCQIYIKLSHTDPDGLNK